MKPTRRTQPLRRAAKRPTSRPLKAAQKGAPAHLTTMHMKRRAAMRKRKRRAKKQNANPLVSMLSVRRRMG